MEITDKELLAICNLSNLKMEFANSIIEEKKEENADKNEDLSTKKIVRNHTISSLLDNEIAGMKKRKEKKREYDNQIYSRLNELSKEVTSDNVREIQEQLNKEYLAEIGKDKTGVYGLFYSCKYFKNIYRNNQIF